MLRSTLRTLMETWALRMSVMRAPHIRICECEEKIVPHITSVKANATLSRALVAPAARRLDRQRLAGASTHRRARPAAGATSCDYLRADHHHGEIVILRAPRRMPRCRVGDRRSD